MECSPQIQNSYPHISVCQPNLRQNGGEENHLCCTEQLEGRDRGDRCMPKCATAMHLLPSGQQLCGNVGWAPFSSLVDVLPFLLLLSGKERKKCALREEGRTLVASSLATVAATQGMETECYFCLCTVARAAAKWCCWLLMLALRVHSSGFDKLLVGSWLGYFLKM